jgi:hypothetical protein
MPKCLLRNGFLVSLACNLRWRIILDAFDYGDGEDQSHDSGAELLARFGLADGVWVAHSAHMAKYAPTIAPATKPAKNASATQIIVQIMR